MNTLFNFILFIFIKYSFSSKCNEGENFCLKCDEEIDLCIECKNEVFTPDNEGGCIGIKKCSIAENFCLECDIDNKFCQSCEIGFLPDNNGGCSFIDNCEISYKGLCYKCEENFVLIGPNESYKYCKSLYSNDLKNCKTINQTNGVCTECEEGYFLGIGDSKCTKTKNCYESNFGTCNKCNDNYYLDRKNFQCLLKEGNFINCKESLNGENCDICDDGYFLSEDNFCINTNFCSESKDYICLKCIDKYFLDGNGNCSNTENCLNSEGDTGVCTKCITDYYLDLKDRKCKSNQLEEETKFCMFFNDLCLECIQDYYLGEDKRCSTSRFCAESENGICIYCSKNYILGKDNKCINTENCAISNDMGQCIECNDGYLLVNKSCIITDDEKFENCIKADDEAKKCTLCKNDFYLNTTNNLCFNNQEYGKFYKCKKSTATPQNIDICIECIYGFYLGYEDRKCTHTFGCVTSNKNNECHRCDDVYYCLDLLNNTCENNEHITDEEHMMFYKCILTNENGTKCEACKNYFEIGENGYCMNIVDCEKKEKGVCVKCREFNHNGYETCLSQYYGCIQTTAKHCLKCDDPFNPGTCTECYEGFYLTQNGKCEPIENLLK